MPAIKRFNFRAESDAKLNINPDTIPTLIPSESVKLLMEGDKDPYYKIQAIPYPSKGNGWNYTESFWQSYIGKLNQRAYPGSARGHSTMWGSRNTADLFVIGGEVKSNGDGTGTVYLKNYIKPVGESGDNSIFIAMNKAGMIDYSIVSRTRDETFQKADGSWECNCIESMGGERNDALDYGDGAMEMKTNAGAMDEIKEEIVTLIRAGKVDKTSKWNSSGNDMEILPGFAYGKDGLVFYSALRQTSNRAKNNGNLDIARLADDLVREIDRTKTNKGNCKVDKKETLDSIATLKTNGEITLAEVAKVMGLEGQLKTNADSEAVTKYNAVVAVLGDDPVAKAKELADSLKVNAQKERDEKIVALAGAKENADKTVNPRYQYASVMLKDLEGEKFNAALEALRNDPYMKATASLMADMTTTAIVIGENGEKHNAYAGKASVTL